MTQFPKLKLGLSGLALITAIFTAQIVFAMTDTINIMLTVDEYHMIDESDCTTNPIDFLLGTNEGDAKSCEIVVQTNNPDGFRLDMSGTANGLYSTTETHALTKLLTTTGEMDTTCTSACTEAWGWRMDNVGTGYSIGAVQTDADNGGYHFNTETCGGGTDPCWHTANTSAETFVSQTREIYYEEGTFDLVVGLVTNLYTIGASDYADELKIDFYTL
ncbi:hypothetical protein KKD70_05370 [Patescibacteria group bacterium]|nr:hypothetical protein [Patescibacteria group bacterium]